MIDLSHYSWWYSLLLITTIFTIALTLLHHWTGVVTVHADPRLDKVMAGLLFVLFSSMGTNQAFGFPPLN